MNISFWNLVSDTGDTYAVIFQVTLVLPLFADNLQTGFGAEQEHSRAPAAPAVLRAVRRREALSSSEGGNVQCSNSGNSES